MSAALGILFAILFEPTGGASDRSLSGPDRPVVEPAPSRQAPSRIDDVPPEGMGAAGAQIIIRERIIIRVPSRAPSTDRSAVAPDREPSGRGPRCIGVATIRSAVASGDGALIVDLGRRGRYWAGLGRGCRAMDFHGGIYVAPAPDGLFCARRDLLRARSGASCMVSRFVDMP